MSRMILLNFVQLDNPLWLYSHKKMVNQKINLLTCQSNMDLPIDFACDSISASAGVHSKS